MPTSSGRKTTYAETHQSPSQGRDRRHLFVLAAALCFLLLVCVGAAVADPGAEGEEAPANAPLLAPESQAELESQLEQGQQVAMSPLTDPGAADELPHSGLERPEAEELLEAVFPSTLEEAAGIFNGLEVEEFHSDHVAVVPPPAPGDPAGLLSSILPLRTENAEGTDEPVDLNLERVEGELVPANPLVEVEIPQNLTEGITLPETGVTIEVVGAPERGSSLLEEDGAFYPEVGDDRDLAVVPTPTGVETQTQLRTPAAPTEETFHLDLPSGASLKATEEGCAAVFEEGEAILAVRPPTAIDAKGSSVPVTLSTSGNNITIKATPGPDAVYPVLVDPVYESYSWMNNNSSTGIGTDWRSATQNDTLLHPTWVGVWNETMHTGLELRSYSGSITPGYQANWNYYVPRYFSDYENPEFKERPTTYIRNMTLSQVYFLIEESSPHEHPFMLVGLWDELAGKFVASGTHNSLEGQYSGVTIPMTNPNENENVKNGGIALATYESQSRPRQAFVGSATVEVTDNDVPTFEYIGPPTGWVNEAPTYPIRFVAMDKGLGVYSFRVGEPGLGKNGEFGYLTTSNGCLGTAGNPCPRKAESATRTISYEPKVLPTGEDWVELTAADPVGHRSLAEEVKIKVDHQAPELALTGSITEQESLGTRRASYTLKATGSDGNAEHPQSGIAKAEVKLDGKAVAMEGKQAEEWAPKCTTRNCPLSAEWTLSTSGLAEGKHTVEVIATDAVGISTTKTLTIETHAATAPTLALSGSMTEQATLGTTRPRYVLKAKSSATAAGFEAPTLGATPTYSSSIGGVGEANGQFYAPADVATDAFGDVWVLDQVQSRLQEFNEKGEWLRKAGAGGSGAGKLSSPAALATDSKANVWVADTANNRIVEFNEKGEFVEAFGTNVNKTKVEAGGTEAEKNLCTAASGNVCQAATAGSAAGQLKSPKGIALTSSGTIWVADTGNSRLEKFDSAGNLIATLSGEGPEPGKLREPTAITVAPDGSKWVADTGNNRIEQWNASNSFVRAVGKEGSGDGEFRAPAAIEADANGAIWVGDRKDNRVEEFDEFGTYLGKFGSTGGGSGQFSMTAPMGLTVDAKGSIWVTDGGSFRVQRWSIPGFPVYASSVGSLGSGNGQFTKLAGLASDGNKGHVWALDQELGRLQEFNEKGEWVRSAGSKGSGAGQLSSPAGVASNGLGNVWVADTANNRVVEFNEKGEFLEPFGTAVNKTKVEAGGTEAEKNLCTAASGNVCQAATAGSAAGQLKAPQGIALTATGTIWVADTGNSRLEKFDSSGNLIATLSGEGTEPGKLKEPTAITVAPDGSKWVADTGNNRLEQWNSSNSFVRAVGKEGSGGGEFKSPSAITADASGNIWVSDRNNNRVEEFGEGGRYFGQFGADGSGKFSFTSPLGIAVDGGGSIWVADPGHSKIQRWSQETPRSEITTTIWMDGVQETTLHGTCKTAGCTIEPWWNMETPEFATGAHTAKVKTTDGLGRSTESTLNIQIARDTTKPTLEASGELVNAPEGWVEQETYGLNATATDAGFGVTSIAFKIDGSQVASVSQACPDGGCSETLSKQISMASYAGGAHAAELVATDGAGNPSVRKWTINVDPEGHISTKEAEATLEAVESTTAETPIASNNLLLQPDQIKFGDNPEFAQVGATITSTGVPDVITMTTNPGAGFTINSPYGETTIVPMMNEASSSTSVVEGVAGVSANVANEVDSVIRPEYNGVETFQAIRSETSPEKYSWNVHLSEGQTLHLVSSEYAEVLYESGRVAFLISVEQAHDATGKEVPTSLEVSGNVLTLHVEFHKASFVYPIMAGAGWETAYRVPVLIEGPENELEIEQREKAEQEAEEATPPPPASGYFTEAEAQHVIASRGVGEEIIPAPEPPASGEASASSIPEKVVKPYKRCSSLGCGVWWVELRNPSYHYYRNGNNRLTAWWQEGTQAHSQWWYPAYYAPEVNVEGCGVGFVGPGQVWAGEQQHLTTWARFEITATAFTFEGDVFNFTNREALQIWVWPNGYQQRVHQH